MQSTRSKCQIKIGIALLLIVLYHHPDREKLDFLMTLRRKQTTLQAHRQLCAKLMIVLGI